MPFDLVVLNLVVRIDSGAVEDLSLLLNTKLIRRFTIKHEESIFLNLFRLGYPIIGPFIEKLNECPRSFHL